jgi:hypothetical protein
LAASVHHIPHRSDDAARNEGAGGDGNERSRSESDEGGFGNGRSLRKTLPAKT